MKIAILTSENQWFVPFAKQLSQDIPKSNIYFHHNDLEENNYDIVFILSYHKIIPVHILKNNKHNIVVHASDLPKGKGWAPMFWQILEGKNKIPFSMFEASDAVDNGDIYMKKILFLNGDELNAELRIKQAKFIIGMCLEFVNNYQQYSLPKPQKGKESFYKKRTADDSEININKTIAEQFNLLRIVDNEDYPAFFYKNNKKYILKIERADDEDR